ncbi:MAG TPA: prepilin peptidase [Candidatus Paceibacterota bacterium]
MTATLLLFLFVLGAIVGSFLNVFVLRRNTGKGLSGRSICPSCGHILPSSHLIPIFSFLALGGRCHFCHTRISFIYPAVELGTGLIFLLIGVFFPPVSSSTLALFVVAIVFWTLALAISLYDLKHTVIPNLQVFVLLLLALSYAAIFHWGNWYGFSSSLLAGLVFALFFFLLWLVSRGRWMGLGDSKLALALGIMVGLPKLFSAWALSFWTGAIIVLLYMLFRKFSSSPGSRLSVVRKPITMKSEIPFGPFLFLGSFLTFLGFILPLNGF